MFRVADRVDIRARLVARAYDDTRICGAALVGSAARDAEDEWSDIDLALQLAPDADESAVVDEWTAFVEELGPLADTVDMFAEGVRYRVYLLESTLQIDLSFWPHDRFRGTGAPFQLLFGSARAATEPVPPDIGETIGMGWLYALHARSAIARGRLWQATMMLDELRACLVTLMCVRSGLNPWHGRDVDRLPAPDRANLERSRAARVTGSDLDPSRCLLTRLFLDEISRLDDGRAARLRSAFDSLETPVPTA